MADADSARPLTEVYRDWLGHTIDEKGVELPHALSLGHDGGLTVMALALPIGDAYPLLIKHWATVRPRELIFAFDRFTKPGQGTVLGDVMAGWHLVERAAPQPFIIEYQHDPRIMRPFDYTNAFWSQALAGELFQATSILTPVVGRA